MSNKPTTLREMQQAKPVAVEQADKSAPAGSPIYEVTEAPHYIGGRMVMPGQTVAYAGKPGRFLVHVSGPKWQEPGANQAV